MAAATAASAAARHAHAASVPFCLAIWMAMRSISPGDLQSCGSLSRARSSPKHADGQCLKRLAGTVRNGSLGLHASYPILLCGRSASG